MKRFLCLLTLVGLLNINIVAVAKCKLVLRVESPGLENWRIHKVEMRRSYAIPGNPFDYGKVIRQTTQEVIFEEALVPRLGVTGIRADMVFVNAYHGQMKIYIQQSSSRRNNTPTIPFPNDGKNYKVIKQQRGCNNAGGLVRMYFED